MGRDADALRTTLNHLHEQLAGADPIDAELRDALEAAVDEIQTRLDADEEHENSLGDRLAEMIDEFEESHPNLAEAIGRVVDALSRLGI